MVVVSGVSRLLLELPPPLVWRQMRKSRACEKERSWSGLACGSSWQHHTPTWTALRTVTWGSTENDVKEKQTYFYFSLNESALVISPSLLLVFSPFSAHLPTSHSGILKHGYHTIIYRKYISPNFVFLIDICLYVLFWFSYACSSVHSDLL